MKSIAMLIALVASAAFAQGASMNCRYGSSCNVGRVTVGSDLSFQTGNSSTNTLGDPTLNCINWGPSTGGNQWWMCGKPNVSLTIFNNSSAYTSWRLSDGFIVANNGVESLQFKSTRASGSDAFYVSTNGARWHYGVGANDYSSSDGTTVTFAGPVVVQAFSATTGTFSGAITSTVSSGNSLQNNTATYSLWLGTATSDATASASTAAYEVQPANAFSPNDLIFRIRNSAGTATLSVDQEADVIMGNNLQIGAVGGGTTSTVSTPAGAATVAGTSLAGTPGAGGAASGATPAGAGGAITLTAALGGVASTTAGGTAANGGGVTLTTGNGGAAATNNNAAGRGGDISLTGGNGGAGNIGLANTGRGGAVLITTGTGGTSAAQGGAFTVLTGNGGSANGLGSAGAAGAVTIDTGTGAGAGAISIGTTNPANIVLGINGSGSMQLNGPLAFGARSILLDKVSSGIGAGSLLATGTNYSGVKISEAWTLTHMSLNVTTASSATAANTVLTTTDGTNTCTFTYACNTSTNTTGVKDATATNGAGTGCVYAANALITTSVTTQGCATAVTTNAISVWGKPQ